jgi:hypothetical protein
VLQEGHTDEAIEALLGSAWQPAFFRWVELYVFKSLKDMTFLEFFQLFRCSYDARDIFVA